MLSKEKSISGEVWLIPAHLIEPDPDQPRKSFAEEKIRELADSILENGQLTPIIVRIHPTKPGMAMIIAGERRWRACSLVNRQEASIIRDEQDEKKKKVLALVENCNREPLNPIEEAEAYQDLRNDGYSLARIAVTVGKDSTTVSNRIALLKLPRRVQQLIVDGILAKGDALNILRGEDGDYLRIARNLVAGKQGGQAALERLMAPHGERSIRKRLPHTAEGVVTTLARFRGKTISFPAAVERFLRFSVEEQRENWALLKLAVRSATLIHLERIEYYARELRTRVLILEGKFPEEKRSSSIGSVSANIDSASQRIEQFASSEKVLRWILYKNERSGVSRKVNLGRAHLQELPGGIGLRDTDDVALEALMLVAREWDSRATPTMAKEQANFLKFCATMRRDYATPPTFSEFLIDIMTLDKSDDPVDLSELCRQYALKIPPIAKQKYKVSGVIEQVRNSNIQAAPRSKHLVSTVEKPHAVEPSSTLIRSHLDPVRHFSKLAPLKVPLPQEDVTFSTTLNYPQIRKVLMALLYEVTSDGEEKCVRLDRTRLLVVAESQGGVLSPDDLAQKAFAVLRKFWRSNHATMKKDEERSLSIFAARIRRDFGGIDEFDRFLHEIRQLDCTPANKSLAI